MERRVVLTPLKGQALPLYVESVGYNPDQEKMVRPHGYPFYHWIQTVRGKGTVFFEGKSILLPANTGILLMPDVSHTYESAVNTWETSYLTFGGSMVKDLLAALTITQSTYFRWEKNTPLTTMLTTILQHSEANEDVFDIESSTSIYHFLINLHKYGNSQKYTAISSNLEKLQPLTTWMEAQLSNPEVGLEQMAAFSNVSPRQLNAMFRETFGISPYAYFLHLRIRKAKKHLIENRQVKVKQIADEVGFRSVSHFVATFRNIAGTTPEQFRRLH